MQVELDSKAKIASIWVTREELERSREAIAQYSKEMHKNGVLVSVFISGTGDLTALTAELLAHNRAL